MASDRAAEGSIGAELERAIASGDALAYVILLAGDLPRRIYIVKRNTVIVGRDDDAEIQILDGSVSGHHARLINRAYGFEIEDLNSTNGTFVRGERVSKATLRNGDRLTIGAAELIFLLERPTSATIRLPDLSGNPARMPGNSISAPGAMVMQQSPRLTIATAPSPSLTPAPPRRDEDDLTMADLAQKVLKIYAFVRERLLLIVILTVLGMGSGIASALVLPPGVSAKAEVKLLPHVNFAATNQPPERWGANDEGTNPFVRSAERTLLQPALIRATLRGLEKSEPKQATVDAVAKRLKVEEAGDHMFRVTLEAPSRGPAPGEFLSRHLDAYVQAEVAKSLRESTAKVEFLRDQVKTVEKDLRQIGEDRARFRSLNLNQLPEDAQQTQSARYSLEVRRSELISRINQLQGELSADQTQMRTDRPAAQTRFQWSETYRRSLAEVNRRLSEAYARGLKDGHPEVQQLKDEQQRLTGLAKDELQSATPDVVRESDPHYQQVENRIGKLRADLSAARADLAETNSNLGRARRATQEMPRVEREMGDLDHRQTATKQLHGELFAKMKEAEIQQNLEKVSAESRYDVSVPFVSKGRKSVAYAMRGGLGLVAGLFVCALVILLGEVRKLLREAIATQARVTRRTSASLRDSRH